MRVELAKRWYSLGDIRVADFNGDGVVAGNNWIMFEYYRAIAHQNDVRTYEFRD